MQLATLELWGRQSPALILGDSVLSLAACVRVAPEARCIPNSVREILEGGDAALDLVRAIRERVLSASHSVREQLSACDAWIPLASAKLAAPIEPRIILACGMNYRGHLQEMGAPMPTAPTAFLKNAGAVIGSGSAIVLPRDHPNMVDWEAEFCGVIGRPCHCVSPDDALDYVAGYTMINDVSARDWAKPVQQMAGLEATRAWDQNLLGKQFPTFCPMGPTLATKDEMDAEDATFQLRVNGSVMQSARTNDLVFSLAALVAHYSQYYRFQPGDVITTGSPAGVGMGRNPRIFLKAGDVVEIEADGIGTLRNPVVASS